ncbi:hypothetical protein LTR53_006990 [Teratosphaeriaceae sp. CCFEE 6253]|nr:hypothetical protein LTR53_006990 [Teratosphaeriaceae sp. CCFEE 6253]
MARPISHDLSPSPPLHHSHHQPQQTLTKRDVRRNRIMERLQSMIDSFSANQHAHYRAQLQAVQVDMTLVLRADPYDTAQGPLEDGGDEIKAMVEDMVLGGAGAGVLGADGDEAAKRDFVAMAGRRYAEFAQEANDELEKRDAELVALHSAYHASLASLEALTQQKLHQAEEEHKALASTIRQRLQASLTKKRQHLLRDKEQLDIADSNALLLHPSHFGINNAPGSPGGSGRERKTRHLRHRAGSPVPGDLPAHPHDNGNGNGNGKRKRLADDDDNESSAPGGAFRPHLPPPPDALGGGRSPFRDARERNAHTQYEAPAYSLERIFTEKELAMAGATAQVATWRYFHQPPPVAVAAQAGHQVDTSANARDGVASTAVPSIDGETLPGAASVAAVVGVDGEERTAHPTTENGDPLDLPVVTAAPSDLAPEPSHQVLTRGGLRSHPNPMAALSDLANAAAALAIPGASSTGLSRRENPFAPVVPSFYAVSRSEKSGAPAPPGVGPGDIEGDFALMRRLGGSRGLGNGHGDDTAMGGADDASIMDNNDDFENGGAETLRKRLLDQALGVAITAPPYRLPILEAGAAMVGGARVERPSWTGFAQAAQPANVRVQATGFGGISGGGGLLAGAGGPAGSMAAALRGAGVGGGAGGEAMSRTTSAGGNSEIGDGIGGPVTGVVRRGRGRVV